MTVTVSTEVEGCRYSFLLRVRMRVRESPSVGAIRVFQSLTLHRSARPLTVGSGDSPRVPEVARSPTSDLTDPPAWDCTEIPISSPEITSPLTSVSVSTAIGRMRARTSPACLIWAGCVSAATWSQFDHPPPPSSPTKALVISRLR